MVANTTFATSLVRTARSGIVPLLWDGFRFWRGGWSRMFPYPPSSLCEVQQLIHCSCSGLSLVAVCINGIANFYHPVYTASQWQTYLMYLGASVVTSRLNQDSILHQALIHPTVMPVFAAPKRISLVTQCALYLTLAGYLVFFVVMLSMHQQVQPGSFILSSAQGNSGWSRGTAWILAINNSMYAYGSTDAGKRFVSSTRGH